MIKDIQLTVSAVFCDKCGEDVHSYDGWPYYEDGEDENKHYCIDCAYRLKKISKREWLERHGVCVSDRAMKYWDIVPENMEKVANER